MIPLPLFRKEFSPKAGIKSTKLLITAAGYYKATTNGWRVGNNMLGPAWTEYGKRIYYSEFDITRMLKADNNCIGVVLGNGFYNPLPMKMWGRKKSQRGFECCRKTCFYSQINPGISRRQKGYNIN
jgi:alpha-L-rhamnosidase